MSQTISPLAVTVAWQVRKLSLQDEVAKYGGKPVGADGNASDWRFVSCDDAQIFSRSPDYEVRELVDRRALRD